VSSATLAVILDGVPIGEIQRRGGERLEFRYDDNYRTSFGALPLSLCMPVSRRAHPDRWISPWLWGLLPDSEDVRKAWCKGTTASYNSAFEMLSTPIGYDCAGAVQFCKPDNVNWLAERGGDLEPLSEHGVAGRLRALVGDETAWLDRSRHLQFSLAGGQRKTALHLADGTWSVPKGATPTTHILKPTIHGLRHSDINEHLCLTAARLLGLAAAQTTLGIFEDQTAAVVTRFDRPRISGEFYRAHQEDLCQALAINPGHKYENQGGPSALTSIDVLRQHTGEYAHNDITRFVDTLALNWLLGGTDGHGKNYSLLIDEHNVRLSPLYDVNSVLPYVVGSEHTQALAMSVGRHYELGKITAHDWAAVARLARLDVDTTIERILSIAARLPTALDTAAADPAVRAVDPTFADQMVEGVSRWVEQCVPNIEWTNPGDLPPERHSSTPAAPRRRDDLSP